jgi:EmrB/QacA subfamily drug resistance transporter
MAATPATTFRLTPELRRTSTVVVLGSIMSILDTTIVAVALATLGRDFHVSVTTIQWVATGYLLALALVTPVTGWAVDRFGAKRLWMSSTALFVIGSCLCGLAWSANSLIAFRVLQGIGGGMLLPVGQSILARAAGAQRMGRVMSIIGVPMVLGPIMGPVIGGLIVSNYSWRWIFYINVPIGIVTLVLSSRWLPRFDTDERFETPFDTLGFCLLSPGLAALLYALSEVGTTGSYTSPSVLISFVLGLVLMAGFILHAVRTTYPLLDLNPFKHRNFAIANVCIFVIGATLFGSMFLLPIYYQVARGQEAWVAGLLMAPQGIGAACIMRWAGSITDRFGPRRVVPFGILLMAVATVPFAFVTTGTSELLLALTLFVRGLGLGLSMMPVTAAAYFDLNHAEIPKASTVMNIVRLVGGSVATALFAVVLERQIIANLQALGAKGGGSTNILGATTKLPPPVADPVAAAFAHTFWWSVGAILIAFVPTLFLPNHAAAPTPDASDAASVPDPVVPGDAGGPTSGDDSDGPRVTGAVLD